MPAKIVSAVTCRGRAPVKSHKQTETLNSANPTAGEGGELLGPGMLAVRYDKRRKRLAPSPPPSHGPRAHFVEQALGHMGRAQDRASLPRQGYSPPLEGSRGGFEAGSLTVSYY